MSRTSYPVAFATGTTATWTPPSTGTATNTVGCPGGTCGVARACADEPLHAPPSAPARISKTYSVALTSSVTVFEVASPPPADVQAPKSVGSSPSAGTAFIRYWYAVAPSTAAQRSVTRASFGSGVTSGAASAAAAATVAVAALVSVSAKPPPSVKSTRTFSVPPASADTGVYVPDAAPAMSSSAPPSATRIHCQRQPGEVSPSGSAMREVSAVSVPPTCAVPEMAGAPVGASSALVTVTSTVCSTVRLRSSSPLVARTVT